MKQSRVLKFVKYISRPKIGIPLLIAVTIIFGPFVFREARLIGVPDIGDPFDVEEFSQVEIPEDENAYTLYYLAFSKIQPITLNGDPNWHEAFDA